MDSESSTRVELPTKRTERTEALQELLEEHGHLFGIAEALQYYRDRKPDVTKVRDLFARAGLEVPKVVPDSVKAGLVQDYSNPDCTVQDLSESYGIPSEVINRIVLEAFHEFVKLPETIPAPLDCFEIKIAFALLRKPELIRRENHRFLTYQFRCRPYRLEDYLERRLPIEGEYQLQTEG